MSSAASDGDPELLDAARASDAAQTPTKSKKRAPVNKKWGAPATPAKKPAAAKPGAAKPGAAKFAAKPAAAPAKPATAKPAAAKSATEKPAAKKSSAAKHHTSATATPAKRTPAKRSPKANAAARSRKPAQPHEPRKATVRDWIEGARLRTLPLAITPVVLGFAAAVTAEPGVYHWLRALAALAVALLLQIGVNFANDYSDGVRGTDDVRVGPPRLTGAGLVKPTLVRNVAFACFGLAALVGLVLVIRTGQWWLILVGAAAIAAAWFYTGGKRPYGYFGLGEVAVFVFFGLVATLGTAYVQVGYIPGNAWPLAIAAGLFACAVLMVNNIRDIDQDRSARKRTLAVLIGDRTARILFAVFALAPFIVNLLVMALYPAAGFALFALLMLVPAVIITLMAEKPADLVLALKLTSIGSCLWAIVLAWGMIVPSFTV